MTIYTCSSLSTPSLLVRAGATPIELSYTYQINTPLITNPDGSASDSVSDAVDRVSAVVLEGVAEKSGLMDCVGLDKGRSGSDWRGLKDDARGRGRRELLPKARGATSIMAVSGEPGDEVDETGEDSCAAAVVLI